jgi:flagellin-like hook-associated protein FlgL
MNRIGTHQTIINSSVNALSVKETNYHAASASLVGVDYALESTRLSSLEIRKQAALSFLSQNNISRSNVYSVLSQQMLPR